MGGEDIDKTRKIGKDSCMDTTLTKQEQARAAFQELLARDVGALASPVLLTMLGNRLHDVAGFSSVLRTSSDLLSLNDAQAAAAVELIPQLQLPHTTASSFSGLGH